VSDPRFSVVIPTFNRHVELTECLRAIAKSSLDPREFEVIVVNDGGESPEQVLKEAGLPLNLLLLSQPNSGPAAARNFGARSARGQFIVFTDDDCIPAADWLEKLERSLSQHPESLHGGRTVNSLRGNPFSETSQSLVDYVHGYYNDTSAERTRFFASNNIAVSARRFEECGGFDESLRAAEDRDFCRTWHNLRWDFRYLPEAIVNHAHHLTFRTLQKQHFNYGRGALPYWSKAARKGNSRLKVEPLSFYKGMLTHPFSQRQSKPGLVSALIIVSQIANALGFAYEAMRTRGSVDRIIDPSAKVAVPSRSY
jgi:GT2 family glycosyltransferase